MKTPSSTVLPRTALSLATVLVVLFAAAGSARAASRWATLQAIHILENPQNLPRPGAKGELGAYQFRASTWRMHTKVPFSAAINRQVSDAVAVHHYEWLKRGLESANVPATPYNIALAWNSGLGAVVSGRSPSVSHDYAQRAANLASSFDRSKTQIVASVR